MSELSRRGLVAYGAAGGVVALGAAGLFAASRETPSATPSSALRRTYSPHDVHQAGIDTPAPAVTTAVAYDLASGIGADSWHV